MVFYMSCMCCARLSDEVRGDCAEKGSIGNDERVSTFELRAKGGRRRGGGA